MTFKQRIKMLGAALGLYEAARFTSKRGMWWYGTRSEDAWLDIDKATLEVIRTQSRHLEHNDWLSNRLGSVHCQYVVGADGLTVVPASSDDAFNDWAAKQWEMISQFIDIESKAGFGDFQWLTSWRRFYDGDCFWHKVNSKGRRRLQFLEAHRCKTPKEMKDQVRQDGSGLSNGVQYDQVGRPVKYYLAVGEDENYEPIDAKNIIHIFDRSRARQFRGLPHLTPVINQLSDLRTLFGLEMDKAKEHASRAMVWKTETGEDPVEHAIRTGETVTDGDSNIGQDTLQRTKYIENVTGSSVLSIKSTEDLKSIGSESPSAATQFMWEFSVGMICAGVNISKLLVMPWSLQGTVTRADLDTQAQAFRAQSWIEGNALKQAWQFMMKGELGSYKGQLPEDWWRVSIRPPRGPNVDVGRNSNAALQELKAGARTFEGWYGELGLDWKRELTQRAKEAEFILKLAQDIAPGTDPRLISDIIIQTTTQQQQEPTTV